MSDLVGATLSGIFPDPVILNILTRLPAKALSQFRSVSKRWNSVLTQPKFITSYLSRHRPTWYPLDRIVWCSGFDPDPIRFDMAYHSRVVNLHVNDKLILKPDEPMSDSGHVPLPAEILHSSNGLVLFAVSINPDPLKDGLTAFATRPFRPRLETKGGQLSFVMSRDATQDVLFVANPTTLEWARIPRPPHFLDWRYGIMIVTRPGPVGEFVVGAFERDRDTGGCSLTCYWSETGKWVKKDVGNNPMNSAHWLSFCRFEFHGKMCWSDASVGIMIWEEDPFVGCLSEEKAVCGFIPLPCGRAVEGNTADDMMRRCVDGAGEWVQYMEMFTEGEIAVEVWRLKGWKEGEWDWELVYKAPKLVLDTFWGGDNWKGDIAFVEPCNPDVIVIHGVGCIFSLNVKTRVVKSCNSFVGHTHATACVIPSWPPSLPPRLYADYIKEQGNASFKAQNLTEAIKCYSRSIAMSPNVIAYANRAMAYLKLGRFCEAEQDCTEALNLDGTYFKAYARRAVAREKLGNLDGALEDIELALDLQPDNKQMKERYDELISLVDKMCSAEGESGHGDPTRVIVMDGEQRAG